MKSPLKWVGGKTQLLPQLFQTNRLEGTFVSYHEPFLGGGSVMTKLLEDQANPDTSVCITDNFHASDVNPALIGFYVCVQTNVEELITELQPLCDAYTKAPKDTSAPKQRRSSKADVAASLSEACLKGQEDVYYWARQTFNQYLKQPDLLHCPKAAAVFLFLNKTGFRGIYRTSQIGFNVPFGHYKNPSIYDKNHLRSYAKLIAPVTFRCESFETALERVAPQSLVYLDPPYVPVKVTSFVSYTSNGFESEAIQSFFQQSLLMSKIKDVRVVLSNSAAPAVIDILETMKNFSYITCSCRRAIHSKNPASRATEVIAWSSPCKALSEDEDVSVQ